MNKFQLLTPAQHKYRAGHSTSFATTSYINDIIDNVINNKPTFLLYLDYKKTFDTVSHSIMLKFFLSGFELSEDTYKWFKSHLTDRKQSKIAVLSPIPFSCIELLTNG